MLLRLPTIPRQRLRDHLGQHQGRAGAFSIHGSKQVDGANAASVNADRVALVAGNVRAGIACSAR
jgi:hypothetical protein